MQVDSLINATRQPSGSERTEEAFQRCILLQNSVEETTRKLKTLTKAAEPAPVGNYDQRKMEEERRLIRIREQLLALALELSPPQKQEGGSSSTKEDEEEEDSEEIETSDEDIIEDNDDEEDVDAKFTERIPDSGTDTFMVISTFKGEQEGDLTIQTGEVLMILSKNKDGWWLAQDSKGNKGLVPKTYLKIYSEQDKEDDDDEEEEEETEVSENENEELDDSKRKSCSNWESVKSAITEMDATNILSAMGAIPAGFRPSTLSKLLDEGISYRGSHFIQPELSQSKLSFKDLFLDPDTGKVRQRAVRTSLTLTLWSCKSIPTPGVGVQVLSRHIRLCAFDGAKVLSNIHTVRATCNSNNVKTWSFSPRMIGILPSLLDGNCFLRCSSDSPELGILFELGVAYIRNSTGERGDLSCGWAFLKLFDANGAPVPYKTYELLVRGGTPYENDVELDPSITRGGTGTGTSMIQQMMLSRKLPKLVLKLKSPKARTRSQLSVLPDTLVGSLSTIPLLVLHRQLLADVLLMDRATMQNADLICSPLLATFPEIVDQSDLLDALRNCWLEAEGNMKRSEKRDTDLLMKRFVSVYMENVYPLLYSADLPLPCWADETVENQRARVIFTSLKNTRTLNPSHTNSGHSPPCQKAFDISQITYDLLSMAQ
uniref:SH3 domain-containing protein n=1 Tax=Esox lucius TaxID=8010 RepID=A0A6Q2XIG3_ESOLU